MSGTALTTNGGDLATALATFLGTLSNPRTRRAYERAVTEAMEATGVVLLSELAPPALVERMDADRSDQLSPATVKLKLAALRSFLNFCRVTGVSQLGKEVIGFVLKSPRSEVCRPYKVPTGPEGRAFLATAEGARERAPVALALGTGLRVSELVNVRLGDFSQDEDGG